MSQELKIRIKSYKEIEGKLKSLGAHFQEEFSFIDTYFNFFAGQVLKITETPNGNYRMRLQADNGKFEELNNEKIQNLSDEKTKLTLEHGIKRILKGKRRIFKYHDLKITLNLIDSLGEFLILTSENPQKRFITDILGIKDPEYITVSFDQL